VAGQVAVKPSCYTPQMVTYLSTNHTQQMVTSLM